MIQGNNDSVIMLLYTNAVSACAAGTGSKKSDANCIPYSDFTATSVKVKLIKTEVMLSSPLLPRSSCHPRPDLTTSKLQIPICQGMLTLTLLSVRIRQRLQVKVKASQVAFLVEQLGGGEDDGEVKEDGAMTEGSQATRMSSA